MTADNPGTSRQGFLDSDSLAEVALFYGWRRATGSRRVRAQIE